MVRLDRCEATLLEVFVMNMKMRNGGHGIGEDFAHRVI